MFRQAQSGALSTSKTALVVLEEGPGYLRFSDLSGCTDSHCYRQSMSNLLQQRLEYREKLVLKGDDGLVSSDR